MKMRGEKRAVDTVWSKNDFSIVCTPYCLLGSGEKQVGKARVLIGISGV